MRIKAIKATPCKGRDLKPGELFSTAGQAYWSSIESNGSVGERLYVRTNTPPDLYPDVDETIYRIEIIKDYPEIPRVQAREDFAESD